MFLAFIFSNSKNCSHISAELTMMNERHSSVMKKLTFAGPKLYQPSWSCLKVGTDFQDSRGIQTPLNMILKTEFI